MRIRFLAVVASCIVVSASAQTKRTYTLQEENDSFFSGTDSGYTNGTRLLWTWTPAQKSRTGLVADWLCRGKPAETCTREVSAGIAQTMFTPAALEMRRRLVGDRPYGGWLYGTMMFDAIREHDADHVEVSLGVVGRHSVAERAQIFIHDHVTPWADDPLGWDNQIGEWPAVLVSGEHSVRLLPQQTASGLDWFDITPALGGSVGNVFIRGTATATVRLGYNLPRRFIARPIQGAPLAQTLDLKASGEDVGRKWDLYVFGGGSASYVARNIFIDAEDTTYRIRREPNVQSYHAGASFRIAWFRLAYQHTWRSPEFEALVRRSPVTGQSWDTVLISVGPNP